MLGTARGLCVGACCSWFYGCLESVKRPPHSIDDRKDRPISSLHSDIQEIVLVSEYLNRKDRHIILSLARLLKDR